MRSHAEVSLASVLPYDHGRMRQSDALVRVGTYFRRMGRNCSKTERTKEGEEVPVKTNTICF